MRFQDWDVLLFPAGSHVPIREFRTTYYAQEDPRTMTTTPLLTAFLPALPTNTPFQMSVHSWTKPLSILGAGNAGYVPGTIYQWRVKIIVDGIAIASETYPEDTTWPKQLDSGLAGALSFPRFHRSILSQSHWNASEDMGRIKIQVSAGYEAHIGGTNKFVKLVDHVVFAFQPAPLDVLERSGIAWPHSNPPIVRSSRAAPEARQISMGGYLPLGDDNSSRSTSAYSYVAPNVYPSLQMLAPFAAAMAMPPPPVPDRRAANFSRSSDVSMHQMCTSYPSCLSEDKEGCLVHRPQLTPRGRKEAVAISSPASSAKKRTRSAMQELKINDGSPEKPARKLNKVDVSDKENVNMDV
ncbi:hypothetical protein LTR17_002226 [Elasticomyces elasticus]|nr:hypothetical protein LTR17_002226 [Elasticomyces elasticus]